MNSLEFAIKMELDGEAYYTEQAKINQDNGLNVVFLSLAKDEENHAKILQNKLNNATYELKDNPILLDSRNIFKEIGNFQSEIKKIPNQLDAYRMALEKERESIDLYQKSLSQATDQEEKTLFEYLIKQEKDHFQILEDLVVFLNRTEDWVEAAEFGLRKEY